MTHSALADPPYASVAPFNGNTISAALGTPAPYSWCAYDPSGPGSVGASQQNTPLSLVPVAAIPCLLAQYKTEEASAGITNERLSYKKIGVSAGGRDLYGAVVNDLETPDQVRDYQRWQNIKAIELTDPAAAQALLASYGSDVKIPIYVENNIHGDEFEGADAMMQSLRDLTTTPRGVNQYVDEILDHAILITVPTQNPDGRVLNQRANGNNFDMNRDWLVQSQSEVRAEKAFIQEWIPTVGLATHGYVNPTLIDGLTKPHNPGLEYDLFAYWNQRRTDANQTALAGVGMGITRPVGSNGVTGMTSYCSAGSSVASGGNCGGSRTVAASPGGATESGNTVTITVTAALTLDFTPGARVTVSGVANTAYNGTFVIASVPSTTSFTYTHPTQTGLAGSGGGSSVPLPGPANAEGWDDWGPFYTQTYLAFLGPDSSTLEMCQSGTGCTNGRASSKRAQYTGFWSSADYWITHRQDMIHDQLEMFRRGVADESRVPCCNDPLLIARGWLPLQQDWSQEYPKGYVIPWQGPGRSQGEANRLVQWLIDNGIQVKTMTSSFTWNGKTFPQGSYVVYMNQALRGLALTTLSPGQDVSQRITQLYAPPGAWSHGYLWGADTVEIPRGDATFSPSTAMVMGVNSFVGGIRDGAAAPSDWYSVAIRGVSDFHAVQALLGNGVLGELAEAPFTSTTGGSMPAGTLIFPNDHATVAAIDAAGQAAGLWFERNVGVTKPQTTLLNRAPKVGILVNSSTTLCPATSTATCSDTTQTLRQIFGADASLLSVTTGTGSIQNAATDPLLGYDFIYNAGQAYPGSGTTARTRMNAFFTRGGGYMATSQSTTGLSFLTTSGNALVAGTFTQGSSSGGGGIAAWANSGGASPLTGGFPAQDYLYLPSNTTYFSATPTGAVVDGRYLANMGDGTNGPTAGYIAGLWRARSTATNNAAVIVHGTMQAPYTGRYCGLATNPFSRQDAEREWTLLGQCSLWSNLTDEAKLDQTITFAAIADRITGDPDFAVNPTASSLRTVDVAATGACTLDSATAPATVHITGSGSCSITASQPGNANFNPAADVTRTFAIGTPPITTATLAPPSPDGSNGWYVSAPTVTLTAVSGGLPVASTHYAIDGGPEQTYTAPFSVSTDGVHTISFSSTDSGGHVEAPQSIAVKVDLTNPTSSSSISPAIRNGWYASPTVTLTGADGAGSGIDHISYSLDGGAYQTYTGPISGFPTGNHFIQFRATDVAGRVESTTNLVALKADAVKPSVNITRPAEGASYPLDKVVTAVFKCTDNESGMDTCVGTVANGANLSTSTVGDHTFTVTATDKAGNVTVVTHHYQVTYTWNGFFAPTTNTETSKLNLVHAGDLIKLGFSLDGDRGSSVFAGGFPMSVSIPCPAWTPHSVPAGGAGTTPGLSFGVASGHYTYGWQTGAGWAGSCRRFEIQLDDGTSTLHTADFMFFA